MSALLPSLFTKEQPWAIRSGCSWQKSDGTDSLFSQANRSFAHKNERITQTIDEPIPNPEQKQLGQMCLRSRWPCGHRFCHYKVTLIRSMLSIEKGLKQKARQRRQFRGQNLFDSLPCLLTCCFASVVLKETVEFNRLFQTDRGKTACSARNWTNSAPQTDATTFALPPVSMLLLWCCPYHSWAQSPLAPDRVWVNKNITLIRSMLSLP